MTISHVCHNWRDIALSLPALWAFVELCPKNDRPGRLEIMIMLLERSRGHPLDVSICFEHDDDTISNYDSDHGGEDLQHDRPAGWLLRGQHISHSCVALARWRSLSIRNLDLPNHEAFIEPLWKGPAPMLEKMDFSVFW